MRVWDDYEKRMFHYGAARLGLSDKQSKKIELALTDDEAPRTFVSPNISSIPYGAGIPIGTPVDALQSIARDFADLELQASWLKKQTPQITVDIDKFSLSVFPVTRLERLLFELDEAQALYDREYLRHSIGVSTLFHPADMSHLPILERYISWLSEKEGQTYRLPTEFEWEYAATGGDGRRYPWGDKWQQGLANTAELGINTTLPVFVELCKQSETKFPIVGMAGNVEEITSSEHKSYDQNAASELDGFADLDPAHRVVRGGSFSKWRDLASCQRRHSIWVGSAFGARLVRE
jgi:formylglycine-generating enzyme required for sulfatase activity